MMSGTSEPDRMCGVFVTRVLKSSLVTLTVTLWQRVWKALPSALNKGTSGVETRMLSFVGAALILVAAAVGVDAAESDVAPGVQAATASATDVITMASAVGRSLALERLSARPFTSTWVVAAQPGHRWDRTPGVTLLGDAAHLVPPNGEGANLAMLDGAKLGQVIAAHRGDVENALARYEQAMFPRAAEAAGEDVYGIMLGDDAPHRWIAMMSDDGPPS